MYKLEKVLPETVGVSSSAILRFLDRIKKYKINLHSFAFIKDGKIFAEGYAKPCFDENFQHRLYSSSKSFVSLAVGKLVGEGKVKLSDRICDFFPEYTKNCADKLLLDTTVEDALKMSVSLLADSYSISDKYPWLEGFFKVGSAKPSGCVFDYNSSGSFVLGCLVEKLTGKTFLEYLSPEFDLIGISPDIWCVKSPDGHAWGSSGVVCTLRDFARFGLLLLDKGFHDDKQLIPRDYLEKATSVQIANFTENAFTPRLASGYGYQFWITDEGFSTYGMGSQYAFCFPKKNFLFVCNGDTQVDGYDFCGEFLYEWVSEVYHDASDSLAPDLTAQEGLKRALNDFSLPEPLGKDFSPIISQINGVKYNLNQNDMGIKWVKVDFVGKTGEFSYENARGIKSFKFGLGSYAVGTFPETHYYERQVGVPSEKQPKMVATGEWLNQNLLLLRVYIVDSNMGNLFISIGVKHGEIALVMKKRAEFFLDDYKGVAYGKAEKI